MVLISLNPLKKHVSEPAPLVQTDPVEKQTETIKSQDLLNDANSTTPGIITQASKTSIRTDAKAQKRTKERERRKLKKEKRQERKDEKVERKKQKREGE